MTPYADLWLGRLPDARRRLQVTLRDLPAEPSRERIRLRLSLGMTALFECDLPEAEAQTPSKIPLMKFAKCRAMVLLVSCPPKTVLPMAEPPTCSQITS